MPDIAMIDADCHYYEPDDAFTRHLEAPLKDRALRIDRERGGMVMLGDERLGFFSVAVGDHAGQPGMLKEYFRSKGEFVGPNHDGVNAAAVDAFTSRAARVQVLDEQRLEACLMLPSWGVGIEPELRAHPDLLHPSIRAFNRWVEDEWGFDDGRILSTAILSFVGVDAAAAEIDRLATAGCRAVCITTGPVDGRSPADPSRPPRPARQAEPRRHQQGLLAVRPARPRPARDLRPQPVDRPVLRGRHPSAGGIARRPTPARRFGLPTPRGPGRSQRVRGRARRAPGAVPAAHPPRQRGHDARPRHLRSR